MGVAATLPELSEWTLIALFLCRGRGVYHVMETRGFRSGFHYTANATTTTHKQSDYKASSHPSRKSLCFDSKLALWKPGFRFRLVVPDNEHVYN